MLTLALLLLQTAIAAPPPAFCSNDFCPPEMQRIADAFADATQAPIVSQPVVASGPCYHQSAETNPEKRHFAVVLLDIKRNMIFMGGVFGFFYQENPFSDWSVATARERSPRIYSDNHRVFFAPDHAFVNMGAENESPEFDRMYWLKQSENKIFLEGKWGLSHQLVCELEIHRS